ncbi:MAG TPA: hypothetical protein VFG53_08280 [Anaeromyxobacter sp.]|nr:hypothetical protein [Anaeromyxobacter sp.]
MVPLPRLAPSVEQRLAAVAGLQDLQPLLPRWREEPVELSEDQAERVLAAIEGIIIPLTRLLKKRAPDPETALQLRELYELASALEARLGAG